MATRDELLPYDKTRLSKVWQRKNIHLINEKKKIFFFFTTLALYTESNLQVMNVESESILLRRKEFFLQYDIEVWLRKEVSFFLFYLCAHLQRFLWCQVFLWICAAVFAGTVSEHK